MKKRFCLLLCCIMLFSVSSALSEYCAHNLVIKYTDEDIIPLDGGTHHSHETEYWHECTKCDYATLPTASSPTTHKHTYPLVSTTYSYNNPQRHNQFELTRGYCICGCSYYGTETIESIQPHYSGGGYTSDSCNGTVHYFYKTCTGCRYSYLYGSSPCDGINHPNYAINKVSTPNVIM